MVVSAGGEWGGGDHPRLHKAQSAATFLSTQRSRDISGQTGTGTIRQQDATFMGIVAWLALAHCAALTRQESPEMKKQCRSSPVTSRDDVLLSLGARDRL